MRSEQKVLVHIWTQ